MRRLAVAACAIDARKALESIEKSTPNEPEVLYTLATLHLREEAWDTLAAAEPRHHVDALRVTSSGRRRAE